MTRPAGILRKKKRNMSGINCMILACVGSPVVGVMRCWINMVTPMSSGVIYDGS
jgi:hypothetical protein